MRRMCELLSLIAIGLCVLWQPAFALDGKDLAEVCADKEMLVKRGVCIGYITGVAESISRVAPASGFCGPDNLTPTELETVVVKYLDQHRQSLDQPAVNLVWQALVAAWPCPGAKKP
jgi:hypothetical protein